MHMFLKIKKIYRYGLYTSAVIGVHRLRQWYFVMYWRKKIKKYKARNKNIPLIKKLNFIDQLCLQKNHASCKAFADTIVAGYLSFLGSHAEFYARAPWHTDSRLMQQDSIADVQFPPDLFFADIAISSGYCADSLAKDIKIPWELSRMQQLPILGHAYLLSKNELYAKKVIEMIDDWINSNSFLYGVNWLNPMEVGLRAISWIVALSMIQESVWVTIDFKQKVVNSLHEHRLFIEGNFEWYDGKTSNHYLSDLVGYLYLNWFFDDTHKVEWVIKEIKKEVEKQLLPDGASYEGSTRYHLLVTELLYYAQCLIEQEHSQSNMFFVNTIYQANNFLWWCMPHDGQLITIGDDDSGHVMLFDYQEKVRLLHQSNENNAHYFKHFGLSIYKTDKVHVALRHHAYTARQPSGHFHNDVASITLAIKGIPVFVDPGSFVYTPSVYWRNYFRSASVHNTSYLQGIEPNSLTDSLFFLEMQERLEHDSLFCARQQQYASQGLHFERKIMCGDTVIELIDSWQVDTALPYVLCWNFMVHPDVQPMQEDNDIRLMYQDRLLATMRSEELVFGIEQSLFALSYGVKKHTNCIRAYVPCASITARVTMTF